MGLTARPEYGGQGMPYAVGVAASELMIAANLSFSMYVFLTHGAYDALDHHATGRAIDAAQGIDEHYHDNSQVGGGRSPSGGC